MMFSVKNPNLNSILIVMLQSQIGIYLRPKIFLSKFPDTSKSDYKKTQEPQNHAITCKWKDQLSYKTLYIDDIQQIQIKYYYLFILSIRSR